MMNHDMWHENCNCGKWLGKLLWVAGLVSLVLAWVAGPDGMVWGGNAMHWYWNALVLGVLAIPLKLKKRHWGMGGKCDCEHCKESMGK